MAESAEKTAAVSIKPKRDVAKGFRAILILSGLIIVLAVIVLGLLGFLQQKELQKAVSTSQEFVANLKDKKYPEAYALTSDDFKKAIKQEDLEQARKTSFYESALNSPITVTKKRISEDSKTTQVTMVSATKDKELPIYFVMHKEGGQWRVRSANFK